MLNPTIRIADVFDGFFEGVARYRVAHGGRGSSKSWTFAQALVLKAMTEDNVRILCARELQKSIKDSAFILIKDSISRMGVDSIFDVGESFIRCKQTGTDFIFHGLKHNVDQIKSLERVKYAWIEEAHKLSAESAKVLKPTVRMEGSEIWLTFNPEDEEDYVSQEYLENDLPRNTKIIQVNWYDNPWFPDVLNEERLDCLERNPDDYDHVWNGGYKKAMEGAYYAKQLKELKEQGYITKVRYDKSLPVITIWDIGISDYTSIWFVQKVGREWHLIDYLQNNNEGTDWYSSHLNSLGYNYREHILPHDAGHKQFTLGGKSIKEQLQDLMPNETFKVQPRTNSVQADIMATRSFLSKCVFDEEKCYDGLKALRNYKQKYSDERQCYLDKPDHNWASHGADAFRYLAVHAIREGFAERPEQSSNGVPTFNSLLNNSRKLKNNRI